MNDSCRASYNCGGQVAFVFRLPAGRVESSGLFLTLKRLIRVQNNEKNWSLDDLQK